MGDNKRWPDLFFSIEKERVALVYPIKKKKGQLHFFIPFIGLYKKLPLFSFLKFYHCFLGFFRPSVRIKELNSAGITRKGSNGRDMPPFPAFF